MLMYTREGTTIVTQQEKVKNEIRQQMNYLFQRLFSVWSFLLSREHHYLFAMGCFHFCTGQAKLSQAHFYSIHFYKVRHFPGKIDNKLLLGVFLEASFPLQYTFKTELHPILYGAGPLMTTSLTWLLCGLKCSLCVLTNSWNSIPQ